jgi:hypothetical protein
VSAAIATHLPSGARSPVSQAARGTWRLMAPIASESHRHAARASRPRPLPCPGDAPHGDFSRREYEIRRNVTAQSATGPTRAGRPRVARLDARGKGAHPGAPSHSCGRLWARVSNRTRDARPAATGTRTRGAREARECREEGVRRRVRRTCARNNSARPALCCDRTGQARKTIDLAARGESLAGIRPAMHPRWLRCSFLRYSRYSRSSRLASGAPHRSRCSPGLSPRAARTTCPSASR